jgi:hypothetical protein
LIEAGAGPAGRAGRECRASNSQVIHSKTGKKVSYAKIVADGKASKVWTADELKAITLKTPDRVPPGRAVGAAARHPVEDRRHGEVRHRCDDAGHALRQAGHAAGALRRQGDQGRR